jgi:hypothetical protein
VASPRRDFLERATGGRINKQGLNQPNLATSHVCIDQLSDSECFSNAVHHSIALSLDALVIFESKESIAKTEINQA